MSSILLRLYSLSGCRACAELEDLLFDVLLDREFASISFSTVFVTIGRSKDEYGVMPSVFPTLVAFVGRSPIMGWEGLADTPSKKLKSQIVRREMAKLVDLATANDTIAQETNP